MHLYIHTATQRGEIGFYQIDKKKINQKVQAGTQSKAVDTTTKVRVRVLSPSPSYIEMTELIF